MNILITGGSGFIGQNLKQHMTASGHKVFCLGNKFGSQADLSLDITNPEHMQWLMNRYFKPEVVIHLAAKSSPKPGASSDEEMLITNVLGTKNVVEYAPEGCVFINASSIVVYGSSNRFPNEKAPLKPTKLYDITKVAAENILFANQNKFSKILNFRLPAVVGPGMTHGVVKAFIDKLKSDSEMLNVIGEPPGTTKQYLSINTLCRVVSQFNYLSSGTYNIVPDDILNIEQLAGCVMSSLGIYKEINWAEPTWAGDNNFLTASNEKILSELGVITLGTSEEAVRTAVSHYKD